VTGENQYLPSLTPKISVASREIPWHPLFHEDDAAGNKKQGQLKTPNKAKKTGFIQAPAKSNL